MTLRGIVYLVIALLAFAVQDAIVKFLTEQHEVIQILTWRIVAVVFILGSVALLKHGASFLKTDQWPLMLLRGVFAFAAFSNYYFALKYIPLGDAATVFMTAPLFVTALSVPLLNEKVGLRRWLAVIIGFAGVVFMLNPGSDVFRPIVVLPLASALFYAFIPIVTRKIHSREHTLTIGFYTSISYALLCIVTSLAVWLWPAHAHSDGVWAQMAQPWTTLDARAWALVAFIQCLVFSWNTVHYYGLSTSRSKRSSAF